MYIGPPKFDIVQYWYYVVCILGGVVAGIRYLWKKAVGLYKWGKRLDDGVSSMQILRENHLPHIEFYLREICEKLDIKYISMEDIRNAESRSDSNLGGDKEDIPQ